MIALGAHTLSIPLIQGGMGIGVSLGNLAGHVAACGGMGVISTAHPGYDRPDFATDPYGANLRALREHIEKAKTIAGGKGMVAVNAMVATSQYADAVRAAIAAGADAIISGAGLPAELPALAKGSSAALAPIVSSARAARTICRLWDKRHGTAPDFVVVEGSEAGGHLGFATEELQRKTAPALETILPEVIRALKPFAEKYGHPIPVFAAGGVYTGADIRKYTDLGAAGAQIATRFIATYECDAAQGYKDAMIAASSKDVRIVKSPVGMPGRALNSPLIQKLAQGGRIAPPSCMRCIVTCDPGTAPYCITRALIEAVRGNWEDGLFFAGSNVGKIDRMRHVSELIDELMTEWRNAESHE